MSSTSRVVLGAMICAIVLAASCVPTATAQDSPDDYVNAHNAAREDVGVDPLSWDDVLAAYAKDYAEKHIADCELVPSGGKYGENLWEKDGADWTGKDATDDWVAEKVDYDPSSDICKEGAHCEHYRQVVWKDTTKIGCARVLCDKVAVFIICSYDPSMPLQE